jgi:hypothetical protein
MFNFLSFESGITLQTTPLQTPIVRFLFDLPRPKAVPWDKSASAEFSTIRHDLGNA